MIFIIGTGNVLAFTPPIYLYNSWLLSIAAALATAKETPSVALAPMFALLGVPSISINLASISF